MVTSTPTKRVRAKAARSFRKASSQETQQAALQQTPQSHSHCESHRDRLLAALSVAPRLTAADAARLKRVVQEAREESVGDLPA
jgi:hypothetical protein